MSFAHPAFFWLLLLLPVVAWRYFRPSLPGQRAFVLPSTGNLKYTGSLRLQLQRFMPVLRLTALTLLIVALARPQSSYGVRNISSQGIDIMLATDISASMLTEDFDPNRLEAAKAVAMDFINSRPADRIGLVVFSGESFTMSPLTTDHSVVRAALAAARSGMLQDGTAIGMGLATSVDRLRKSDAKSRVVILLTDGVNNRGFIDPLTGAEIAKKFGVRVYTIGMGSEAAGSGRYAGMELDEKLLKQIADMTGGKYFRATDNQKLREIYQEIDRLEKSFIQSSQYEQKADMFHSWVMGALLLLGLEYVLRYTYLKTLTES